MGLNLRKTEGEGMKTKVTFNIDIRSRFRLIRQVTLERTQAAVPCAWAQIWESTFTYVLVISYDSFKKIAGMIMSRRNKILELPLGSVREISGRKMGWLEDRKGETN